ncbi:MAG: hypothetical protein HY609_06325 [Deltaproteobacteria bacterium]|nr:hypothetical protein [Deltaproteobacteria bacterium]MBI4224534.1 hypothetical protein [Deltaproteobacteria bacterium]
MSLFKGCAAVDNGFSFFRAVYVSLDAPLQVIPSRFKSKSVPTQMKKDDGQVVNFYSVVSDFYPSPGDRPVVQFQYYPNRKFGNQYQAVLFNRKGEIEKVWREGAFWDCSYFYKDTLTKQEKFLVGALLALGYCVD